MSTEKVSSPDGLWQFICCVLKYSSLKEESSTKEVGINLLAREDI